MSAVQHTLSNSETIWPGPNSPRLPPVLPEGHVEYCLAKASNSSACFSSGSASILALISLHLASSLTKMWLAVTFLSELPDDTKY